MLETRRGKKQFNSIEDELEVTLESPKRRKDPLRGSMLKGIKNKNETNSP